MTKPTPEQLADAGVEIVAPDHPEADFEQVSDLPAEPASDVMIRLADGTELRERISEVTVADGFNVTISNALLAPDGSVARDEDGAFRIVPPEVRHEFSITGVRAGAMTRDQVEAALAHARRIAAGKARRYFAGMDLARDVFRGRMASVGGNRVGASKDDDV